MTGKRMGIFFLLSLYLLIIVYHFFHSFWLLGWPKYVILGLLLVSFVLWVVTGISRMREFMAQKNVRFFVGLTAFLSALLIALGVVNWFVATNNKVWDWTKNQSNSLSEQTLNIVQKLDKELTVEVWTRSLEKMSQAIDAERLFRNYETSSKGKIKLVVKDPNAYPSESKEKNITRDPTIIVRSAEGRENRVESFNDSKAEEDVTNAIIRTLKGQKKTICFLSGHKELGVNDKGPTGLSVLRDSLEASAYQAQELLLPTHEKIPDYCEMLVIPGPQSDPLEQELKLIQDYVAAGGPTLALFGPEVPASWQKIFESYQIKVKADVIIDPRIPSPPLAVLSANYNDELEFFSNFDQPTFFRFASSVEFSQNLAGFKVKPFVSSESVTFARSGGLRSVGNSLARRSVDFPGPHPIGVMVEAEESAAGNPPGEAKEGEASKADAKRPVRFAVVGSFFFAANGLIGNFSNQDLLLSTINYLAGDKDIVGIRPRSKSSAHLDLTMESLLKVQGYILLAASVFLVMGVWSFRRRRAG